MVGLFYDTRCTCSTEQLSNIPAQGMKQGLGVWYASAVLQHQPAFIRLTKLHVFSFFFFYFGAYRFLQILNNILRADYSVHLHDKELFSSNCQEMKDEQTSSATVSASPSHLIRLIVDFTDVVSLQKLCLTHKVIFFNYNHHHHSSCIIPMSL